MRQTSDATAQANQEVFLKALDVVAAGTNAYAGDLFKDPISMSVRSGAVCLRSFQRLGRCWWLIAGQQTSNLTIDYLGEHSPIFAGVKNVSTLSVPRSAGNVQGQGSSGGSSSIFTCKSRFSAWNVGTGNNDNRRESTVGIGVKDPLLSERRPANACMHVSSVVSSCILFHIAKPCDKLPLHHCRTAPRSQGLSKARKHLRSGACSPDFERRGSVL